MTAEQKLNMFSRGAVLAFQVGFGAWLFSAFEPMIAVLLVMAQIASFYVAYRISLSLFST